MKMSDVSRMHRVRGTYIEEHFNLAKHVVNDEHMDIHTRLNGQTPLMTE
jgi:hypothetical protein